MIKKYFLTGLALLMPLVITLLIFIFLIDILTTPFLGIFKSFLAKIEHPFFLPEAALTLLARVLIILVLCVGIFLLGVIARWFFFNYLLKIANKIFLKIPLVKGIYGITKDIAEAIFSKKENGKAFKKPVMVPFPSKKSYCVGFESGQIPSTCAHSLDETLTPVFIPTAPHPISGYLLLVKRKDVLEIPMSNEEALKFTVSCGVVLPESEKSENTHE